MVSSAMLLTACDKKQESSTEQQVTQGTVASAADMEVSSNPEIVTPPDQIDAAP